ncbi:MAG: glycosyltransferase family 39 protein [Candidatus Omnitrophica bacterium]|nr:glycosyltransferase family 39 protein [Candidatus Omnitrophota bacterium]
MSLVTRDRSRSYLILAVLFISAVLFTNYLWIKDDNSIRGDGSQNHLLFSIDFYYLLSDILQDQTTHLWTKTGRIIQLLSAPPGHESVYWPNGLNLTAFVFYSLFGKSLLIAKLSLFPYVVILLYATYSIGKWISSGFVGILASFVLFMYPIIFESSRQFQPDLPLTSMVALDVLLLLKSDEFRNRKYSFLFGLSLGWSMLIKGQAMLFIMGPLAMTGYRIFRNSWKASRIQTEQLQNGIIGAIVSILIASLWWGPHLEITMDRLEEHILPNHRAIEAFFSYDEKYSMAGLSYHPRALFHYSVSPVLFLISVLCFISFLRGEARYKDLLLAWLLIPFLLFSFVFTAKDIRFLMPILPIMALVTAHEVGRIKRNGQKIPLFTFLVFFSLTQFYLLSYASQEAKHLSIGPFRLLGVVDGFIGADYGGGPPHKEEFKIKEIIGAIKENADRNNSVKIGWITVSPFRPSTLEFIYWLRMKDSSLNAINLTEMPRKFLSQFDLFDFILFYLPVKNASLRWPQGEAFEELVMAQHGTRINMFNKNAMNRWNRLLKILEEAKSNFQLVREIPVDQSSVYYLYKRKSDDHKKRDLPS